MRIAIVALFVAAVVAMPTEKVNGKEDPEFKPVLAGPQTPEGDEYTSLHAEWHEPKADRPKDFIPQSGSLISTEVVIDKPTADPEMTQKLSTEENAPAPPPGSQIIADAKPEAIMDNSAIHPNPSFQVYPVERDQTERAYKESSEKVAGPTIIDPAGQDIHGVTNGSITLDRPEFPHPMEEKTPLADNNPCDPTRIIKVEIPVATEIGVLPNGLKVPFLPSRYGCSSAKDISREKLSPKVSWSNVAEDVFEFSLQMIDMGDSCEKRGNEYGRIHWHVTGIKASPNVTLEEGASHDSRMLHGGQELTNQWLEDYYSGPCPLAGTTGCYRFKVLAHRANGWCQCGFQDVLFSRPAM